MNFDFLDNKNVQLLFSIFEKNKNNLFIVGGAVRNTFANFPITDIDFCTSVKPDNIIKILKMNNIEYSDIGKKFGTITAHINNEYYEITTLREDIYKKTRFPIVKFIKNIKQDAFRRDFTMNAIYIDKDKNIYDRFNGIDDIKNKIVKFIGNPEKSITKDPLRILRYFRFCAEYFHENFDKLSLNTCLENFDKSFVLSKKKFNLEYQKIIEAKGAKIILDKWEKFGILEKVNNFLKEEK